MRRLLACGVALAGLLGLEMHAASATLEQPPEAPAPDPVSPHRPVPPAPSVDSILERPLFAADRHPSRSDATQELPPRLAGLVLAPSMQVALLQTRDADGIRPLPVGPGGEVSGWKVLRIDPAGVILQRDGRRLQLTIRQAGARPLPPTPIDQLVLMPQKHINPQLAW